MSKGSARWVPSEDQEQRTLCEWLGWLQVAFFAVPNGRYRRPIDARILKATGVQAGVPDLVIIDPPPLLEGKVGTVVEMKRADGGAGLSPGQLRWFRLFRERNWATVEAHGFRDARAKLMALGYGGPRA